MELVGISCFRFIFQNILKFIFNLQIGNREIPMNDDTVAKCPQGRNESHSN